MVQALGTREAWYSLIDKVYAPSTLGRAWQRMAANAGAAGVDGVSVARDARTAPERLHRLREALQPGAYRPQAVRRVESPKSDGGRRPLGIPTLTDRGVQAAVAEVIERSSSRGSSRAVTVFARGAGARRRCATCNRSESTRWAF